MSYPISRSTSRQKAPEDRTCTTPDPTPLADLQSQAPATTERQHLQNDYSKPSMSLSRQRSVAQVSRIHGSYDEDSLSSSYGGGTLYSSYVDEHNAIMMETWSAPTLTDPDLEPFEVSQQVEYVRQALEPCSHRSPPPAAREAEQPTRLTQSQLEATKMGTHCAMAKFMAEDMAEMPPSEYNPRLPSIICAFCGAIFTDPNRQQSVVQHVRETHTHASSDLEISKFNPTTTSQPSTSFRQGTTTALWKSNLCDSRKTRTRPPPARHDLNHGYNSNADFSQWPNAVWSYDNTVKKYTQLRLIQCDNPMIPQEQILFALNSLDPHTYPDRPNNFFNGLDLIVGNLQDRFPNDVAVQGCRNALTRLEQLFDHNFGALPSEADQKGLTKALDGRGHHTIRQHTNGQAPPSNCQLASQHTTTTSSSYRKNQHVIDGGRETAPDRVEKETSKPRRKREAKRESLLACPDCKNHQVHDSEPSCSFRGANYMSEVLQHLRKRPHSQFWLRCMTCYKYSVSQAEMNESHGPNRCQQTTQPRGMKRVVQDWENLYRVMFPLSERIPSPWIEVTTYSLRHVGNDFNMPHIYATGNDSEFNFNDVPVALPFLGQLLPEVLIPPLPVVETDLEPQGHTIQEAEANGFALIANMLSQYAQQPFDLSDRQMTNVIANASRRTEGERNAFCDGYRAAMDQLRHPSQAQTLTHEAPTEYPGAIVPEALRPNMLAPDDLYLGQFLIPADLTQPPQPPMDLALPQPFENWSENWFDYDMATIPASPLSSDHIDRAFYPDLDPLLHNIPLNT